MDFQGILHQEVMTVFADAKQGIFTPEVEYCCEPVQRNGIRRERRTCTVLGGPGLCEQVADPEAWPSLRNLIRVCKELAGPCGRRQRSLRQNLRTHVSIGLLRDRIGRHPWILASALP